MTKQQVLDFVNEAGIALCESQEFKEEAEECSRNMERVKIWIEAQPETFAPQNVLRDNRKV